ncbi:unnamed protein product [Phyllotreta striolata]|uniref:Uncharacterized protein n=1 Tax=Phyllotreta striolata TaxID=444603 RepID=A0A9N9TIS2_PHYSR|nr:unnamed protein product [Phyllotreta striolata]
MFCARYLISILFVTACVYSTKQGDLSSGKDVEVTINNNTEDVSKSNGKKETVDIGPTDSLHRNESFMPIPPIHLPLLNLPLLVHLPLLNLPLLVHLPLLNLPLLVHLPLLIHLPLLNLTLPRLIPILPLQLIQHQFQVLRRNLLPTRNLLGSSMVPVSWGA